MKPSELSDHGIAAFNRVASTTSGFRARPGQLAMAQQVSDTFSVVSLGKVEGETKRRISVIQAGTGTGKSIAYAAPAIAIAMARKTRVVISTATVALQEQLMTKDLPDLAKTMPEPFVYGLAKGRGRYVCKLKLGRLVHGSSADEDGLFEDEDEPRASNKTAGQDHSEQRLVFYRGLADALDAGTWDGDRDALGAQPDARDWSPIAAERHTCTARFCPQFKPCSYYSARAQLASATVIVANHDLVLASLGTKLIPEFDDCLVVFDEGHHLPAVAIDQFTASMDLVHLRWLDRLPKAVLQACSRLQYVPVQDVPTLSQQLRSALNDLSRLVMDHLGSFLQGNDGICRFENGVLPEFLHEPLALINGHSKALSEVMAELSKELKEKIQEDPLQAALYSGLYAQLGALAPRLDSVVHASTLLTQDDHPPLAKWFAADDGNSGFITITANACPIVPGDLLSAMLWSGVRGAVITSATLTSCGSFDFFLSESGLQNDPATSTLEVSSPFDYASQGRLIVVETATDPKDVAKFTEEMIFELVGDLQVVASGALALFTSKVQMKTAVDALPPELLENVLVQGTRSRGALLQIHRERVAAGRPSILFGLQSFGEGMDLPGALCETLFITKLPFAPPSDPVGEARAEWLRSIGKDPFSELVVPATGIKLLQWTGRAIRAETDTATVICYDRRLVRQGYGRRMLKGLPSYALSRSPAGATRQHERTAVL